MAQFTNQASLTYNGMTINSNIVTGEVTPTLIVTKTAAADVYNAGDTITYVITLRNVGNVPFNGLSISDDLGAYTFGDGTLVPLTYTNDPVLYYVDGVLQASPTVVAGPPMVISGINVPAGSDAALVYRVEVNEAAPLGNAGVINNTATVTGSGLTEALTAADSVTANTATRLNIVKALEPTVVPENGQITYTFTLVNYGAEATTTSGITLSDTFTPRLEEPLTVLFNGATLPTSSYSYDATTGLFTTVAGALTVPAATQTQDPTTGAWTITPGTAVLTITGTI